MGIGKLAVILVAAAFAFAGLGAGITEWARSTPASRSSSHRTHGSRTRTTTSASTTRPRHATAATATEPHPQQRRHLRQQQHQRRRPHPRQRRPAAAITPATRRHVRQRRHRRQQHRRQRATAGNDGTGGGDSTDCGPGRRRGGGATTRAAAPAAALARLNARKRPAPGRGRAFSRPRGRRPADEASRAPRRARARGRRPQNGGEGRLAPAPVLGCSLPRTSALGSRVGQQQTDHSLGGVEAAPEVVVLARVSVEKKAKACPSSAPSTFFSPGGAAPSSRADSSARPGRHARSRRCRPGVGRAARPNGEAEVAGRRSHRIFHARLAPASGGAGEQVAVQVRRERPELLVEKVRSASFRSSSSSAWASRKPSTSKRALPGACSAPPPQAGADLAKDVLRKPLPELEPFELPDRLVETLLEAVEVGPDGIPGSSRSR